MAIRSGDVPLGVQEILTDIGGDVASRADLIGLGVIVGASAGVIGGGDNVIMPGDFYGEDISLTATSATFSTTSHNFANTGGEISVTISNLNGIFRLSNVPGWAFTTPTYGTASTTTLIISAGNNSSLGALANASTTIQLLGASDAVLASIAISQDGNPVTFEWLDGLHTVEHTAGTVTNRVRAASMFSLAVVSSNTSLATISIGTATGTNPKTHPITISHFENFNTGSAESCQITATGTASAGTISKQISLTQTAYIAILWAGSSANLSDDGGTAAGSFAGATSVAAVDGGHPFTISFSGGTPSWISVSPTSGIYSPNFKAIAGQNTGTTFVTFTFSANTTSSARSTIALVTDTNSGHITSLNLTQPAQELTLFDIDSGESSPHILNLPAKADISVGTYTLQVTANSGFNNDWEIEGTADGILSVPSSTPPKNYDTSYLQHKKSTDSTWTAITTALTGTGNATIEVRNPSGYWKDFNDLMTYPYYRFRSQSYPTDYTETVTILQPIPPIDFDLVFDPDTSQHTNALSGNSSTNLKVYSNTNQIDLNAYAVNGAGIGITATIKVVTQSTKDLFTTTNSFPALDGSSFYWSTHPDSTQNSAGRTYYMDFEITNSNSSTSSITNQQWMNFYVKATSQTQSEGQSSGGYSKLFIKQLNTGGGGTPPGPPGPGGPGVGPKPGGGIE